MIDWILIGIGLAVGGGGSETENAQRGAAPGFEAEDQTPTGKFTTAAEVKQIVGMTKANWVAVREYNAQDWVYATQLLSWRCGMHQMRFAINDGPMEVWDLPRCQMATATPNAFPEGDLPYRTYPPGHVQTIDIEVLFDDLDTDSARFERAEVMIP